MKHTLIILVLLMAGIFCAETIAQDTGIPYQKQPRENLMVGGQPTLNQLEALKADGYTTVVNLRREGEFDDFDEAAEVAELGMEYIHIPIKDIDSITLQDANALHAAITGSTGPVLLHCTVGWRASGLFAIENHLLHDASKEEALKLAQEAHMSHAVGDVADWIDNSK
jgi:uncharacterized protein (TIGR01244 family)